MHKKMQVQNILLRLLLIIVDNYPQSTKIKCLNMDLYTELYTLSTKNIVNKQTIVLFRCDKVDHILQKKRKNIDIFVVKKVTEIARIVAQFIKKSCVNTASLVYSNV